VNCTPPAIERCGLSILQNCDETAETASTITKDQQWTDANSTFGFPTEAKRTPILSMEKYRVAVENFQKKESQVLQIIQWQKLRKRSRQISLSWGKAPS
jgi:hypothetical protein